MTSCPSMKKLCLPSFVQNYFCFFKFDAHYVNNGFQRSSHKQAIIGVISYFFYGLLLLKKANFHTNDVIQWLTTKDEYAKRLFLFR